MSSTEVALHIHTDTRRCKPTTHPTTLSLLLGMCSLLYPPCCTSLAINPFCCTSLCRKPPLLYTPFHNPPLLSILPQEFRRLSSALGAARDRAELLGAAAQAGGAVGTMMGAQAQGQSALLLRERTGIQNSNAAVCVGVDTVVCVSVLGYICTLHNTE